MQSQIGFNKEILKSKKANYHMSVKDIIRLFKPQEAEIIKHAMDLMDKKYGFFVRKLFNSVYPDEPAYNDPLTFSSPTPLYTNFLYYIRGHKSFGLHPGSKKTILKNYKDMPAPPDKKEPMLPPSRRPGWLKRFLNWVW